MLRDHSPLTGKTIGNLYVLGKAETTAKNSKWLCECLICGAKKTYQRPYLTSGNAEDCGCRKGEKVSASRKTHGQTKSPLHKKWMQMRHRVNDPSKPYVRRGITVCDEWDSFEVFAEWALANGFDPALELDRIDNDKGYSPENCRWVNHRVNCQNRSKSGLQYPVINDRGDFYPSAQSAALALGGSRSAVNAAIKTGYRFRGCRWFPAPTPQNTNR